ncbi:hypothetical protein HU200_058881 [Digitaria exilis]|uniref:non-specific serine/threonine protein kinase n=1 Tax=Digitaria exilis TaxID=1010633 RepID=A0A835E092_9POAL|nr:hypothetical protein HU200_058881 [Digitaria exilis]
MDVPLACLPRSFLSILYNAFSFLNVVLKPAPHVFFHDAYPHGRDQAAQKLVRSEARHEAAVMADVLCPAPPRALTGVPFLAVLLLVVLLQQASLLPLAMAQTTNLTVGDTLSPPGYITSPSGSFTFGFRAHDTDPAKFILATWFRFGDSSSGPPPPQSVVWFAKESPMGATPNATSRSILSITNDGQLTLSDGSNKYHVLWTTSSTSTSRGSVLTLTDSGNARFLGDDDHTVLWESFSHPTDTLLPGQTFQGMLFSKRADTEFTTGRFSLAAQDDGNVVLYIDLFTGDILQNAYWATGTNSLHGNTTITLDDQGGLSYTLYNGTVKTLISPLPSSVARSNYLMFARMDPDGIVRTYFRPDNNGGEWTVSGTLPSEGGCDLKNNRMQGMCGPGSYCVETRERLNCLCPPGYTYIDAQHTDSGCTPEFEPQACGLGSPDGEFSLVEVPNTIWEISIYYKKFPSVTEQQCRDYCLHDCFCTAALMMKGSDCLELGALAFGRHDVTTNALVKVRNGNNTSRVPSARTMLRPYMIIVPVCLGSLLVITVAILVAQRLVTRDRESQQQPLCSSVRAFSWKELYKATNGFEKLLGKGSFGEVYQGTIRSPQPHLIAVKKLYSEQEFANEVQSIGQIHHRNLVRMIGYCKQGKHRMLVFEFMPGGSLRSFLFNPEKRRPPWRWRVEAAVAIARGLEYLHDGCSAPIIHCDIKPDNILLDEHGVPRITDFGISKLLGSQQVHTTVTHVRGTRGYIAPEWLRGDARVDTKADVYSFGVLLLEMICCRRCQEPVTPDMPERAEDDDETVTLFGWAAQLVGARRTEVMVDGDLDIDTVEDTERVEKFARVALWCMEPKPLLRPTMHQVVQMLETRDGAQVEALPDPPSCYMESRPPAFCCLPFVPNNAITQLSSRPPSSCGPALTATPHDRGTAALPKTSLPFPPLHDGALNLSHRPCCLPSTARQPSLTTIPGRPSCRHGQRTRTHLSGAQEGILNEHASFAFNPCATLRRRPPATMNEHAG